MSNSDSDKHKELDRLLEQDDIESLSYGRKNQLLAQKSYLEGCIGEKLPPIVDWWNQKMDEFNYFQKLNIGPTIMSDYEVSNNGKNYEITLSTKSNELSIRIGCYNWGIQSYYTIYYFAYVDGKLKEKEEVYEGEFWLIIEKLEKYLVSLIKDSKNYKDSSSDD